MDLSNFLANAEPPKSVLEPAFGTLHGSNHHKACGHFTTTPLTEAPDPWEPVAPLGGLSEPPPSWPWDAIPLVLSNMGEAIEKTINVSGEMAGAAVLGAASIAIGNKVKIVLKHDHRQFANLFFMVAADVAGGKTPATKAAQAPLLDWQRDQREPWKKLCDAWEARQSRVLSQIRGFEDEAKQLVKGKGPRDGAAIEQEITRLRGELTERPPEPVLFCADATSEALGRRMQEHNGAIGVLSGEARKIIGIAKGRYAEGGDIDLWLAGHAGDHLRVDRSAKDKPSYEIKEACLAAAIMTQPDSLQSLGASEPLRESGFLARWLYLLPDHNRGSYPVDSVPLNIAEAYSRTVRALVDLPPAVDMEGASVPHLVGLTSSAFARWRQYHDAMQTEIKTNREIKCSGYLQWLSKLAEHIARLALLFHVVRNVEAGEFGKIDTPEIEDAITLAEVLKVHARRAFALMGADLDTARARKVLAWLERSRGKLREWREKEKLPPCEAIKPRDLIRYEVAGIKSSKEAEAVLMLLADKGYVQAVNFQPPKAKMHLLFYLRPASLEADL